jgi:hypothetical protein
LRMHPSLHDRARWTSGPRENRRYPLPRSHAWSLPATAHGAQVTRRDLARQGFAGNTYQALAACRMPGGVWLGAYTCYQPRPNPVGGPLKTFAPDRCANYAREAPVRVVIGIERDAAEHDAGRRRCSTCHSEYAR